jgi:hypothetical protein
MKLTLLSIKTFHKTKARLVYDGKFLPRHFFKFQACDMLEKGVAAIFGPEQAEANEIIQSVSSTVEIPHFQTFWNPNFAAFSKLARSDKGRAFSLNLHPGPTSLSRAFATLVRENDWKTYTIIYENDDGLGRVQEVVKAQNPANPPVVYRKLGPGPDHRSVKSISCLSTAKRGRRKIAKRIQLDVKIKGSRRGGVRNHKRHGLFSFNQVLIKTRAFVARLDELIKSGQAQG